MDIQLTRWADDWVVTCRTRAEAQNVLARAGKILEELGVTLNREKTRIVHIAQGFEFLGFKIQRGKGQFKLAHDRIKIQTEPAESLCHSHTEVGGPIQGSDQGLDQEAYASASGRIDQCDQPDHPRMGTLLLSLPG